MIFNQVQILSIKKPIIMGTINQGITGGFSGKVGTVVGGNWNGIDYMRSKESGRSDAKSNAQLNQRAKFLTVV